MKKALRKRIVDLPPVPVQSNTESLKIKIRRNSVADQEAALQEALPLSSPPECFFPETVVKTEAPTWIARRFNIKYSSHKLNASAYLIRNRHFYDAMAMIKNSLKKGSTIVRQVLDSCRYNGIKKGYSEDRFWVKEVIIGRRLG
jgi:hypothetical protein